MALKLFKFALNKALKLFFAVEDTTIKNKAKERKERYGFFERGFRGRTIQSVQRKS